MSDNEIHFLVNPGKKGGVETHLQWLFAHGAGAPMDSDFMDTVAMGVAEAGITVKRFEFPYMVQRRLTGKKRPPDRAPLLKACFLEAIQQSGGMSHCVIGGKSMGGRMASVLAAEHSEDIPGVVCLGYPFHPVGKIEKTRIDHFSDNTVPHRVVQGTRDALGDREQVATYGLPSAVTINWLEDGNHDFKPRKKSGLTHEEHIASAINHVVEFIRLLDER